VEKQGNGHKTVLAGYWFFLAVHGRNGLLFGVNYTASGREEESHERAQFGKSKPITLTLALAIMALGDAGLIMKSLPVLLTALFPAGAVDRR
jgi:hypothetical protein